MNQIVIDHAFLSKLDGLHQLSELRDATGRLLGYFAPTVDPAVYRQIDVPITEDELDRRSQAGGGRPLDKIIADLENRQ